MLANKVQEMFYGVTSLCRLAGRTTEAPRGHRDTCGTLRLASPAHRLIDAGRTALRRPGDLTDTPEESAEEFVTLSRRESIGYRLF